MIGMVLSLLLMVVIQNPIAQGDGHLSASLEGDEPGKSVSSKDPVITISGLCGEGPGKAGDSQACKTIVTKEHFERLMAALAASGQPVPLNTRQQLAQTYADLLAYEEAARASGLERSPEFQDLMTLVRLRTLAEIHRRNLQAKYRAPSREDIDQYYRQNPLNFTEIKLRRILVPRKNPSAGDQQEYEKKALEVANGLRERAAKGNDFEQLQKEGYARLGLILPPATDMGDRRKANLLAEYRDEVFSLSTGEVSKVEQEAFSFVIYKVEEKKLLSQETVREEISHAISKQRLDNALKEITSGVHSEFNRWYFDSGVLPINPSTNDGQQSTK